MMMQKKSLPLFNRKQQNNLTRLFEFDIINTELTFNQLIYTSYSLQSSFQLSVEMNSHMVWFFILLHMTLILVHKTHTPF